jgi:nitrogen fixation NifU-like protein
MSENDKWFDELEEMLVEEARKTYSPKVMDHFENPRNFGQMENADAFTMMSGICGDTIGIYIKLNNGEIAQASFITNGCGATIACASAVTTMAQGMPVKVASQLTGASLIDYLDGLPREHTHCADLAVNTLRGALEKLKDKGDTQ